MSLRISVDENVLATLLPKSELTQKITYQNYREPFVRFFEKHHQISPEVGIEIFGTVFTLLVQGIKSGVVSMPIHGTLFNQMICLALQYHFGNINEEKLPTKNYHPYLSSEVIVQLIKEGEPNAFVELVKQYQNPLCKFLQTSYYSIPESPMEVFGETMMAAKENILTGKLKGKMSSCLFTYVARIVRNKFLKFNEKMNNKKVTDWGDHKDKIEFEYQQETSGATYFDLVEEKWPILSQWIEDDKETVFERILSMADDISKEIFTLRYMEGLSHVQISERKSIKVSTSRKRLFDAERKLRKIILPQ